MASPTPASTSRSQVAVLGRALAVGTAVGVGYLLVAWASVTATTVDLVDPTRLLYPLLWLMLAATAVTAAGSAGRLSAVHVLAGVTYAGALAWLGGLLQPGFVGVGLDVTPALPGWGPVVLLEAGVGRLVVVPFQIAGYLAVGYLFARALAVSRIGGRGVRGVLSASALGAFTCVGCLAPLVLAVASAVGLAGGAIVPGASMWIATLALAATLFTFVYLVKRGVCHRC